MWDRLFASEVGLRSDGEAAHRDPRAESMRSARLNLTIDAALCQTKSNSLPGEGREMRNLLSISIN